MSQEEQNPLHYPGFRTRADIYPYSQGLPTEATAIPLTSRSDELRNQRNFQVARRLGIRTSADIFREAGSSSRNYDEQNQRNIALGGLDRLGIRTSADIFREAGSSSRNYDELNRQNIARAGLDRLGIRASADIPLPIEAESHRHRISADIPPPAQFRGGRKRAASRRNGQQQYKRPRTTRSEQEQLGDINSVLRSLDEDFAEKEHLSYTQSWCNPIPQSRKVSTVQQFYTAFHDMRTLPIHTCLICYRKFSDADLVQLDWQRWVAYSIKKTDASPFQCDKCFHEGKNIPCCFDCEDHLKKGLLSQAARLHESLGCEHMFPEELKGLTPIEEKLIALNSCYGFITKFSLPDGRRQNVRYPKHVKGHITVFPNNVQDLVTNVLPHPLVRVLDDIHVSWEGPEKPSPSDLTALLSVRRSVVERALVWLKRNNPLYSNISIDSAEMDTWDSPAHGVPSQVYAYLERNEPSAWEKARTGHVVPRSE